MDDQAVHAIQPLFQNRFRPSVVKEVIQKVLAERLTGHDYNSENTPTICREVSDEIRNYMKDMDFDRYKYCVQVVIGEQKGEGIRMGFKALWDQDTDNFAQAIFMNESIFCMACVFGTYYYA